MKFSLGVKEDNRQLVNGMLLIRQIVPRFSGQKGFEQGTHTTIEKKEKKNCTTSIQTLNLQVPRPQRKPLLKTPLAKLSYNFRYINLFI